MNITYFNYSLITIPALVVLILTIRWIITGARAVGGGPGTSFRTFVSSHKWLIVSAIAIPGAYYMLTGGSAQTLVTILAVIIGIFAMNALMNKPPSSWISLALVALVLLFIGWGPTWHYVEQAKDWWVDGNFANSGATDTTSNSTRPTRVSLCVPGNFVEKKVNSRTTPVRFVAELRCPVFAGSKTVAAMLRIRFNNEKWQEWEGNTQMPTYRGTIRFMDVLGEGTVKVQFGL